MFSFLRTMEVKKTPNGAQDREQIRKIISGKLTDLVEKTEQICPGHVIDDEAPETKEMRQLVEASIKKV